MIKRDWRVLSRSLLSFVGLATLSLVARPAMAVPEMARFGYFSCNTCHVSPSGGGILTTYGRSISAERLSTWSAKGEEGPLEGAVKGIPEWLLLGGDVRYLQLDQEDSQSQIGRLIRMQTDLAVGIQLPHVTIVAQGGPHGDEQGRPEVTGRASWREYYAKVDINDEFFVRGGRFLPKYGLNIPEHTVNVRKGLGFDEGDENENGELTYSGESNEVTLTRMTGIPKNEFDGSPEQGYAANWSYYLLNRHRIGISALRGNRLGQKRVTYGASGVFAIGEKWFLMTEEDKQTLYPKGQAPTDQVYFFNKIGYEPIQGVVPFLDLESTIPDVRQHSSRQDMAGIGLQWYPRPHFDIESLIGATLKYSDYTFSTTAYLMGHYYL